MCSALKRVRLARSSRAHSDRTSFDYGMITFLLPMSHFLSIGLNHILRDTLIPAGRFSPARSINYLRISFKASRTSCTRELSACNGIRDVSAFLLSSRVYACFSRVRTNCTW